MLAARVALPFKRRAGPISENAIALLALARSGACGAHMQMISFRLRASPSAHRLQHRMSSCLAFFDHN
jgi:hypothetical protein